MCGISGIAVRAPLTPEIAASVSRMDERLTHRGPDGAGGFTNRHVALASRRLSIIDHAGGAQPLYNEDRSHVLVANGEIYNFVELRRTLQSRGHRFGTKSDCEVILHLYEEYGDDCVHHLRGMFAFALWDANRNRLLLARDRMGEKPLYLYEAEGSLMFASELRALLASGVVPRELNPEAVNLYFHYQYVPEPLTPIQGVRKLDAAHLLTIEVDSWRVDERCYWRMEDAPPLEGAPDELIREQLETIGKLTIRADTPVGVALSGGLDSSILAALAARETGGAIHAFSVGYEGRPESDERIEAQQLTAHLGLPFHEVELKTAEMVEFFPQLVRFQDDPIADISGYGYYSVMRAAREHGIPVMLQGQGGDELFWGYPLLQQAALQSRLKMKLQERSWGALPSYLQLRRPALLPPRAAARWLRDGGGALPGWRQFRRHQTTLKRSLVFYDLAPDYCEAVNEMPQLLGARMKERLRTSDAARVWTCQSSSSNIDIRLTRLICDTYLRENGIAQCDRLSMASSVELRLPLVDHVLVETVIGLRKTATDVHLPPKTWLRSVARDVLPRWALERPKRGFAPPTRLWHDRLFAEYGDSLSDGYLVQSGVLSHEGACHLAQGDFAPNAVAPLSFKALVLEQWCRQVLRG